ncbi:MAG: GNAT family N-acetyltransferase [Promethearchaeota archaeon]
MKKIIKLMKKKRHLLYKIPENLKNFQFKICLNKDLIQLLELYDLVFPSYMIKKLWDWKNLENPFGNFITVLLKDKNNLIGAYSVSPRFFYINGKKVPCVLSLDTMTHPQYRGMGISTTLATIAYEIAKINGYYFVYGFPNNNSVYMFEKKLNWKIFGKMIYFTKEIEEESNISTNYNLKIREINVFDKNLKSFIKKEIRNYKIIINKSLKYLNWRYVQHPTVSYKKFLIYSKDYDKEILGFFILKIYNKTKDRKLGHIIDFMIKNGKLDFKKRVFKFIENFAINYFYKNNCSQISFWLPDKELIDFVKNELNYKLINDLPYFGYKVFKKEKSLSILNSFNNWYIVMGNNDVF